MRRALELFLMVFCTIILLQYQGEASQGKHYISIVTFRYDAARDVVLAKTTLVKLRQPISAQAYANALSRLPDMSYTPTETIKFDNPIATYNKRHRRLSVNYRNIAGLDQLASAQTAAVLAALEAWWWVPDVNEIYLQLEGRTSSLLGPLVIYQPLRHQYHTYILNAHTGEIGYLYGNLSPSTIREAVSILNRHEITTYTAMQGFQPILPPGVKLTYTKIHDGILSADLSPRVYKQKGALAALVLMFTQYKGVHAVQFTFDGQRLDMPFMHGNLSKPITASQLEIP